MAAGDSDIDSLAAFTRPDNTASKRLFSRAGFVGPIWSKPNTLDAAPEHAWRFHLPLAFKRRHSPVDPRYVVACRTEWFWQALHARRDAFPGKIVEVRSESELAALSFETLNPRYIFFPHWSSKVPPNITSTYECVCFHGTDLPFGRGGSPVQNLIARGISESNLTALRMVEEFDAGPTYLRLPYSLQGSATDIFASMSGLTVEMMLHIALAEPEPISQEGPATNFKRRTPSQSNLEQASNDLDGWYDLIRMLDADGYPHAYIDVGNLRLNFRRASRKADHILADVTILERVKKK